MPGPLRLEVVTPERLVLQTEAEEVIVPAYDGLRGILPDHEPLVTNLRTGELSYTQGGRSHSLLVGSGLLEVRDNVVNVLVETAQKPQEINVAAFQEARRVALEKLHRVDESIDYQKVQAELETAEAYLSVSSKQA